MVEDRGDGELASVSLLPFFKEAVLSLIHEDYTPNPADTEYTCACASHKSDTHILISLSCTHSVQKSREIGHGDMLMQRLCPRS